MNNIKNEHNIQMQEVDSACPNQSTQDGQSIENNASGFSIKISKKPVPATPRGVLAE